MFDSLNSKIMNLSFTSCMRSHVNRPPSKSFLPLQNLLLFSLYQATHTQTDHSKAYFMTTCLEFNEATTVTSVLITLWLVALSMTKILAKRMNF